MARYLVRIMVGGAAFLAAAAGEGQAILGNRVIDNDEVSVLDLTLGRGAHSPATPHDADAVILYLGSGRVSAAQADGTTRVVTRRFGDAVFVPRGNDVIDTLFDDAPMHEAIITLKDHIPVPLPNTTGFPLAFPRPGAIRRLHNDRVTVWNYSWQPARPTRMHFHDKDVVVAFRYDGDVVSTASDGMSTTSHYQAGDIRLAKAARVHSEKLTSARESAVMVELTR